MEGGSGVVGGGGSFCAKGPGSPVPAASSPLSMANKADSWWFCDGCISVTSTIALNQSIAISIKTNPVRGLLSKCHVNTFLPPTVHFSGLDLQGHMPSSLWVKAVHNFWMEEETEYFLQVIKGKNMTTFLYSDQHTKAYSCMKCWTSIHLEVEITGKDLKRMTVDVST